MANSTARAKSLIAEKKRREKFPAAIAKYIAGLFPEQLAFVNDTAKRIVTHSGRRAGKTHGLVGKALQVAEQYPGCMIPVVERTLTCMAANEFWEGLQDIDKQFGLDSKFSHTIRHCTLKNGSKIALFGADTAEAADKLRGHPTPLALVDEVGSYRQDILEYLCRDVLSASTLDFDGTIVLAGTPNPTKTGFFYRAAYELEGWSRHHWTCLDNPYAVPQTIPANERRAWTVAWLAKYRADYGLTESSSSYIREWLGLWADTFDDRMYNSPNGALIAQLPDNWPAPNEGVRYFLAADVGIVDPCAFVVWARRDNDPCMYVVESYEQPKLIPSTFASHVDRLDATYHFAEKVIDAGGLGKAFQAELLHSYGIDMANADKQSKVQAVDAVNGDLRTGRVKIVHSTNRQLVEELRNLPWNAQHTDAKEGYADHLPDAFLYGSRLTRRYAEMETGTAEGPRKGSKEWWQEQESAMEADVERQWAHDEGDNDGDCYDDGSW